MNTMPAMVPRDAFIAVAMLSERKDRTLFIDVTSNVIHRNWQHRVGEIASLG
jgi:predicted GIY-YIG superfamily endonuclease